MPFGLRNGNEEQWQDCEHCCSHVDQQYSLRWQKTDEQGPNGRRNQTIDSLQRLIESVDTRQWSLGTIKGVEADMAGKWNAPPNERTAMMA